ncbi:MAG: cadmium-translocating P-type ATPase [Oscillospiraceae bacterium]|nr:cadmium-translocating P-type ATPase [Oscillospiraceae bacterium]
MTRRQKKLLIRIASASAVFIAGLFLKDWWRAGCMIAAWLIVGYDVLWAAIRNILRGQIFDEKFLMALATCAALGMQDWAEAAAVMLFFQVGELFELLAVERSRRSISSLMDIRPDMATVLKDGEEIETDPEDVAVGDLLLVRAGERIPTDGVIVEGEASLDTAKVTGEAMPVDVSAGMQVVSGSVNLSGVLTIRAESAYAQSTVARILSLVETAAEKKAQTERIITKFAHYYTPAVIGAAVLLALVPPLAFGQPFAEWIRRALTFLVISCPCALVISVPLSFFSGMGAAAKHGIVVKGGVVLEQLARTKTLVFDKTGTLTEGSFRVQSVRCAAGTEQELLRIASLCEQYSNHPVARAITAACPAPQGAAHNIREQAGYGITAEIDGRTAAVGNARLMASVGVTAEESEEIGTHVYVAYAGTYLGMLTVADSLRGGVTQTLHTLAAQGIERTVMLTGDNERSAAYYAAQSGVKEYHAQLLPQDKVSFFERILNEEGKNGAVAFVGDGVNDAPVLTAADVGIAMGGVGSEAAVEAADAVLLKDDVTKLPILMRIAKKKTAIAKQNIAFALIVKGVCLVLGALGYAPMWLAIFADVGVAVLAILNAFRTVKT